MNFFQATLCFYFNWSLTLICVYETENTGVKSLYLIPFYIISILRRIETLTGEAISRLGTVLRVPVNVQEGNCLGGKKRQIIGMISLDLKNTYRHTFPFLD